MKAILHIGLEKTGTTTLQSFLALNREALRAQGIAFLRSCGAENDRDLPSYAMADDRPDDHLRELGITSVEAKQQFKRDVESRLANELETVRDLCHTAILSSEHFQSRLRTTDEMTTLRDLLMASGLEVVRVIVYLRSPAEIYQSSYSTSLRNGSVAAPPTATDNGYWNLISDHKRTLQSWESVFGRATMHPRLYDRARFHGGSLIADFSRAAGLDPTGLTIPPDRNRSLDARGQTILRLMNRWVPRIVDGRVNPRHRSMVRLLERHFTGSLSAPAPELVRSCEERFAASNEWVRKVYFPDVPRLFPTPDLTTTNEPDVHGREEPRR